MILSQNPPMIPQMAEYLDAAMRGGREVDRLTTSFPDLSNDDAYQVQEEGVLLRLKRGEKIVGFKMGLTSKAKREQMSLHSPIYGVLTDHMEVRDGAFSLTGKIHPKIEPEIAFFVERELKAPLTREEALAACGWITCALEILDSRYLGFKYFSLPDVIADNASSSHFILGKTRLRPDQVDVSDLEMVMEEDGQAAQSGSSKEISEHPLNSLVQLVELLGARGLILPAGSIVLAGAATAAIPLKAGSKVSLKVATLGDVSVSISP